MPDVRTMSQRMMVGNLDAGLFLIMRPNPQTFAKQSRKRVNEVLTNSGFNDVFWGNERDIITVSGVTASKIGNPEQYKNSDFLTSSLESKVNDLTHKDYSTAKHGPKQWADVDRFILKLEQIYKLDKERIGTLLDTATTNTLTSWIPGIEKIQRGANRDALQKSIKNGTAARAKSFIIYDYCIYWGYFTDFQYTKSATDKPRQISYTFNFKVTFSTTDWLSQSLISNFPEYRALNFFTQVGDIADYAVSATLSSDKLLKGLMI